MSTKHITNAIAAARKVASTLEDACPASQADTPAEDIAHVLIHALNDAALEAEYALVGN